MDWRIELEWADIAWLVSIMSRLQIYLRSLVTYPLELILNQIVEPIFQALIMLLDLIKFQFIEVVQVVLHDDLAEVRRLLQSVRVEQCTLVNVRVLSTSF